MSGGLRWVKAIPKAERGIGKRVSQIVLKMSGKFVTCKIMRDVRVKFRLGIGQ